MNSGTSWTRRDRLPYRRLCARAGCGAPAAATLRFQPTLRQAWLVDLDETAARTQGDLCHRHAAALVLPRGWELHDERTGAARPVAAAKPEAAPAPARRVRVRRRAAPIEAAPERDRLPGFEPAVATSNGHRPAEETTASDAVEIEIEVEVVAEIVEETAEAEGAPRSVPAQFGANDDDVDVDNEELNAVLDARTPLLQRAFRNAQPRD